MRHVSHFIDRLFISMIFIRHCWFINSYIDDVHAYTFITQRYGHLDLFYLYSISQEICTRFCCALLCCGYAIVHNEFTWSIYPYSSGLLCWSKPDGYGKISQCITTTKHSKAKTVCIFLGIYCICNIIHNNAYVFNDFDSLLIYISIT